MSLGGCSLCLTSEATGGRHSSRNILSSLSQGSIKIFLPDTLHEFDQLCTDLGIEHRLTPPMRPQTNGMVERFNGRIEDVLQSHRFQSGEDLEQTILRYVTLYNQQLPQAALASRTPLQAMKDWHKLRPELFKKQPYYLTGCDT